MDSGKYLNKNSNTKVENKLLKFIVTIIGITQLVLGAMMIVAMKQQRTILVPAGFDQRLTITGNQLSKEYVILMSRYVTGLVFTYTPGSARGQFMELLSYYAPEFYPEKKAFFLGEADKVEAAKYTSIFHLQEIVDKGENTLEITGIRLFYTQVDKVDEKPEKHILKYRVNNGKFEIIELV